MENKIRVYEDSLLDILAISEDSLLDILKQLKFKFTLKEIDSIIPPKIKENILDKIW